ncbi:MAG: hypothetical protein IJG68_07325 [Bacilli bacterium]|nr:hypothetical protein [Bacilli bacterium]
MKNKFLIGLCFILLGFGVGKIIFMKIDFSNMKKKGEKYYFLQEGVYQNGEDFSKLKQKITEYQDNKIYVYAGITKSLEVAERLLNIYDNNNISLSIKEKYFVNEEFKNNVEQFDYLILSSNDSDEVLKIEEVVLANYEEIIKNR